MEIIFDSQGTIESFKNALADLMKQPHINSIFILSCDNNGYDQETIAPILKAQNKTCFGGIFPKIIHEGQLYDTGNIFVGFFFDVETIVIDNLGNKELNLDDVIIRAFPEALDQNLTMLVLVDGLSSGIGCLMESLFDQFGLEINYLGGGAGSLSLKQCPCVMSSQGLHQDSAILAAIPRKSGVGVSHGWTPISEALKVTESEGNRIISLNWEPAFQEYRRIVELHSKLSFDSEEFFEIAKAYPFGIAKLDAEMVIRDPLLHDKNDLVCVGEVPQGTFVHVMHGDTESLISAAGDAMEQALEDTSGLKAELTVFIDCISRMLFLNQDYPREVHAVTKNALSMVGALTLGEIANNGRDYLEFYNKTAVIGLLTD
ncbi:MAG: FIST C-terminal domain-containing protein [Sedimenticola sp.]